MRLVTALVIGTLSFLAYVPAAQALGTATKTQAAGCCCCDCSTCACNGCSCCDGAK